MKKVQWIVSDRSSHAVITSPDGYINLTATRDAYIVQFISHDGEEGQVYSSSAKNLSDAKKLSVAFGHALLQESSHDKTIRQLSTLN